MGLQKEYVAHRIPGHSDVLQGIGKFLTELVPSGVCRGFNRDPFRITWNFLNIALYRTFCISLPQSQTRNPMNPKTINPKLTYPDLPSS